MKQPVRILISNDDGVYAPGIRALYLHLRKKYDVTVVAPLEEKSMTGHFLTLHKPLRIQEIEKRVYGVSGGPADAVYIALNQVMVDNPPDMVIAGINRGSNLGQDLFYSGTLGATREACLHGLPSVGISLATENFGLPQYHYESAAKVAELMVEKIDSQTIPRHSYLNINVPNLPFDEIRGWKTASQGRQIYRTQVEKRTDIRRSEYYWIGGEYEGFDSRPGTDCSVVYEERKVSLTMHNVDTVCKQGQARLDSLDLEMHHSR